ncbi:MAG: glutamate--cysteine ligase, partial [Bacteriovoracia bacterium]
MEYVINKKYELEEFISSNWEKVNSFLDEYQKGLPVPIYASVDIRESHNKYAPVDHNLYPAGFNNLCQFDLAVSGDYFKKSFLELRPECKSIAIIPESHTKNAYYLDHLYVLSKSIAQVGFDVSLISFDYHLFPPGEDELHLISFSNNSLTFHKAAVEEGEIQIKDVSENFDIVLLNHDQSHPIHLPWDEIKTLVLPTPKIGWFKREKVKHFEYYKRVCEDFCNHFKIEPDLLMAKFKAAYKVDFSSKEGLEQIATEVDNLLQELPSQSKVFVKANQGTYGMGISVVASGEEIKAMNRKQRNKMDVGKNHIKFT